jgi:hypothetical protein
MFYTTKYNFEVNQSLSEVNTQLRAAFLRDFEVNSDALFGKNDVYVGTYNYDEFVLSMRSKPFQKTHVTPDAHIKLQKIDEANTLVNVTIQFAPIWKLFFIGIQIIVLLGTLFIRKFNFFGHQLERFSLMRFAFILGFFTISYGVIWIVFQVYSEKYKRIIRDHYVG